MTYWACTKQDLSSISKLRYSPTTVNVTCIRFKKKKVNFLHRNPRLSALKNLRFFYCQLEDPECLAAALAHLNIETLCLASSDSFLPALAKLCFPQRSAKTSTLTEINLFRGNLNSRIMPELVVALENCHTLTTLKMRYLNYLLPEQFGLLTFRWGSAWDIMFHKLSPEQLFCLSRLVSKHSPETWATTGMSLRLYMSEIPRRRVVMKSIVSACELNPTVRTVWFYNELVESLSTKTAFTSKEAAFIRGSLKVSKLNVIRY